MLIAPSPAFSQSPAKDGEAISLGESKLPDVIALRSKALEFLERAKIEARKVDRPYERAFAWISIGRLQIKASDSIAARQTFEQAIKSIQESSGLHSEIRQGRLEAHLESNDPGSAENALAEMKSPGDRVNGLYQICLFLLRSDKLKDASNSFERMRVEAIAANSMEATYSLADVCLAFARAGDLSLGRSLLERTKDIARNIKRTKRQDRDETLSDRAKALCAIATCEEEMGDVAKSWKTLREATKVAMDIKDIASGDDLLELIHSAQVDLGDFAGARTTLKSVRKSDWIDSHMERIASAQAAARDFSGAKLTAKRIVDSKNRDQALASIAADQARGGQFIAAKATVGEISGDGQRNWAWRAIAQTQAHAGDTEAARATVAEIKDPDLQRLALKDVNEAKFEAPATFGTPAELGRLGLGFICGTPYFEPDYLAYTSAKKGDLAASKENLAKIKNPHSRARALAEVSSVLSSNGDFAAIESWLIELVTPLEKAHLLSGIAKGLLELSDQGSNKNRPPRSDR